MAPLVLDVTHGPTAGLIRANLPDVEAVGRLSEAEVALRRHGEAIRTKIYWADPEILDVLRLPTVAGNAAAAPRRESGIVERTWKNVR